MPVAAAEAAQDAHDALQAALDAHPALEAQRPGADEPDSVAQLVVQSGLKVTPGILQLSGETMVGHYMCPWRRLKVAGRFSLRGLNLAPEWFRMKYNTSQNFTWAFAGFSCLLSSFWPDGHATEKARCEICIGCLAAKMTL